MPIWKVMNFKEGDKVVHIENRTEHTVYELPGNEHYDSMRFAGARYGMLVIRDQHDWSWDYQENYILLENADTLPKLLECKKGDRVVCNDTESYHYGREYTVKATEGDPEFEHWSFLGGNRVILDDGTPEVFVGYRKQLVRPEDFVLKDGYVVQPSSREEEEDV